MTFISAVVGNDGVAITEVTNSTFSSSMLRLSSLAVRDGGRYECVGSNRQDGSTDSTQAISIVVLGMMCVWGGMWDDSSKKTLEFSNCVVATHLW